MTKKFSPNEVDAIFLKAASLDLQLKDALSIEQIRDIASESGISQEALDLAITEVEKEPKIDLESNFFGKRFYLSLKRFSSTIYTASFFLSGKVCLYLLAYLYSQSLVAWQDFPSVALRFSLEMFLEFTVLFAAICFPFVLVSEILLNPTKNHS